MAAERYILMIVCLATGMVFVLAIIEFFIRGKLSMISVLLKKYRRDEDKSVNDFERRVMKEKK